MDDIELSDEIEPVINNTINVICHTKQPIIKLGVGSYSDVYKITVDNPCETPCDFCRDIPRGSTWALKQILLTEKYNISDFYLEAHKHRNLAKNNPSLFVGIGNHWLTHNKLIPENIASIDNIVVTDRPKILNEYNIQNYGYIMTEYMDCLDLYSFYKSPHMKTRPLNLAGLLMVLFIILDRLHNKYNTLHGDLRDRNIFLKYHGPNWRQLIQLDTTSSMNIDTGGYEIKLGDFGLTGTIIPGTPSFIIRDYEFIENIYCQRNNWELMASDKVQFLKIIEFIRQEFMLQFYSLIAKLRNPNQTNREARHAFWFNQHRLVKSSIYYYELPARLLKKYITEIYLQLE